MNLEKNKSKYFWWILLIFFVVFMGFNIALETGYYETKLRKKTYMTEQDIEKFETDVKEGKELNLDDYLTSETKDYSNKMSKLGNSISSSLIDLLTNGLKKSIKVLGKLFGK